MTWMHTPKKLKKNVPKRAEDSDADESHGPFKREDESDSEDGVLYFLDGDYAQRVPNPRYQQVKTLELMAMSAQKLNPHLRVHVVCSGLPYGNGEANDVFYEFFRRAWLSLHQDLASLPIVGSG